MPKPEHPKYQKFLHEDYCDNGGNRYCSFCHEKLSYQTHYGYQSICTKKLLEAFLKLEEKVNKGK